MHWWFEHMSSMFGAFIATTAAFLVVNAPCWGLDTYSIAVWLAPTILIWTGHYRRKFGGGGTTGRPSRGTSGVVFDKL
jgi:hypothetical protein